MNLRRRVAFAGALAVCVLAWAVRAGHDDVRVDLALKRSPGKIIALGPPDEAGNIYSFRAKPLRAPAEEIAIGNSWP